jgi:arylsulfatase A-like enzyme
MPNSWDACAMTKLKRTAAGRGVLLAILGAFAGGRLDATEPERGAGKRPNFLFVLTDDQRWDAMAVVQQEQGAKARFPWLETPNLDRLAREGVRFRNAFVVNSLCAPSRAAFLTGRYNHANGIVNNHTPFPENSITFASLLRQAGYRTGYVGKWHMDGQRGKRPGFDYSASFIGQGRYMDCPFEINGQETETSGWVDDVSTDFAIQFLESNQDGPFALVVGFKSVHGPRQPPERLKAKYAGKEAKPAPNADHVPPYLASDDFTTQRLQNARKKKVRPAAKDPAFEALLNYFRLVAAADENLGRLLDALDRLKLAESTVVVFASDNGYYLGEHGLGDKRTAYDESLRIPLLVRCPQLGETARGQTNDAMVLNIDLAPTLLDLAGVAVPSEMQGRSWRPLLAGLEPAWRTSFFYEYFYERNFRAPHVLAVRTEDAKLIQYPGHDDWTELFNLRTDPYETRNLISDAQSADLLKEMQRKFAEQSQAVTYNAPAHADPVPGERRKE